MSKKIVLRSIVFLLPSFISIGCLTTSVRENQTRFILDKDNFKLNRTYIMEYDPYILFQTIEPCSQSFIGGVDANKESCVKFFQKEALKNGQKFCPEETTTHVSASCHSVSRANVNQYANVPHGGVRCEVKCEK